MRTDSFSQEKHLPVRRFIADESKVATGLYGPRAIADDIDNIHAMFDPDADILGGDEKGGIGEKNLQDGAISYNKLQGDIRERIENSETRQKAEEREARLAALLDTKAEKSTTLKGYGITDAYTVDDIDQLAEELEADIATKADQIEVDNKLQEVVLFETTVNTPVWTNQPSYSGDISSVFTVGEVYYITLKDTDGSPLKDGQFKLMDVYFQNANAYEPIFTLTDLNPGNTDKIVENKIVELTQDYLFRDAGVPYVEVALNRSMDEAFHIKLSTIGEFVKRSTGEYISSFFRTDKNVSNYHSTRADLWNTDAAREIWHYISMQNGQSKNHKFRDDFTIHKTEGKYFWTERNLLVRALYDGTTYKHSTGQSIGFGEAESGITLLCVRQYTSGLEGVIRNGSIVRVTEVK